MRDPLGSGRPDKVTGLGVARKNDIKGHMFRLIALPFSERPESGDWTINRFLIEIIAKG